MEHADARYLSRWLRIGGERRREQAQDERDNASHGTKPHGPLLSTVRGSAWCSWVHDCTTPQPQGMAISYWVAHLLTSSVVLREAPREVRYLAASRLLWSSSR